MTTSRYTILAALLLATTMSLVACGSSTEQTTPTPTPTLKDRVPATITAATTSFTGTVGTQLPSPLTVVVKNKAGEAIDTAVVTFAVASGGGSVGTANARTNAVGEATTTWTLGTAPGTQSATATVGTLAPVTFTATVSAAGAAKISKSAGDAQSAAAGANVAIAPAVKVTDQFDNPLANVAVIFNVASGGGTVTGGIANTNASGIATVGSWKLGTTVGPNTLTATAGSLPAVTFSATATAGAVSAIRITSAAPPLLSVGQTFTVTAAATDANGNAIASPGITYSSSNTAVATVNSTTGVVTAVGSGNATISASVGSIAATQAFSVLGHPSGVQVGSVAMNSSVAGTATTTGTAYVARSSSNAVSTVDLASATITSTVDLTARPVDVAVSSNGSVIVAPTTGPPNFLRLLTTTTLGDSIGLSAAPVKAAVTANGTKAFVDLGSFNMAVIDIPSRTVVTELSVPGTLAAMKIARGDTLLYAATRGGVVFEISTATNVQRRRFDTGLQIQDFDVSPDGKTLFVADGSAIVTMIRLATGGLSGTIDFGTSVAQAVAMTPDGSEIWISSPGKITAAPFQDGEFQTGLVNKRYDLTGITPGRIVFTPLGDFAVVTNTGGAAIIIYR
jgi:hypothetical protein